MGADPPDDPIHGLQALLRRSHALALGLRVSLKPVRRVEERLLNAIISLRLALRHVVEPSFGASVPAGRLGRERALEQAPHRAPAAPHAVGELAPLGAAPQERPHARLRRVAPAQPLAVAPPQARHLPIPLDLGDDGGRGHQGVARVGLVLDDQLAVERERPPQRALERGDRAGGHGRVDQRRSGAGLSQNLGHRLQLDGRDAPRVERPRRDDFEFDARNGFDLAGQGLALRAGERLGVAHPERLQLGQLALALDEHARDDQGPDHGPPPRLVDPQNFSWSSRHPNGPSD